MGKDKVVLFIVEGYTDKTALKQIFQKIYKNKGIHFAFTHGDVTSDDNNTIKNIEEVLYSYILGFKKDNKLENGDIWQVIQLFDMDGAYIEDADIISGENTEIRYDEQHIYCKDVGKVIHRNEHKRELMNHLLTLDHIKSIPYRCFFLSSNLDHALYNRQNLTEEEKQDYADEFVSKFQGHEMKFVEYLESIVVKGVPDSYPSSWRYIREGKHSLERHTNLHIYFKEYPVL